MSSQERRKIYTTIGLMSGTSMDGTDLALIRSDGADFIERKNFSYTAYTPAFKKSLQHLIYGAPTLQEIKLVENELTLLNAKIVNDFLEKNKIDRKEIDAIAFHGHTILHAPEHQSTWQIGNPELLAAKTGINIVADFRNRDVAFGGQGAPLVPIYHFYLLRNQKKPVMVLNIGGISNITYFAGDQESDIEAFDICFGNAPFDDLIKKKLNLDFDRDGELSKNGKVDLILADRILCDDIFSKKPPKSFDRDDFSELLAPINSLKIEDALATFAYMHAKVVQINLEFLSQQSGFRPKSIFVCGGGRKNVAIMGKMKKYLVDVEVLSIDDLGFNGDAIEAEAFAFLAIRRLLKLPISFQKTTGISPVDNCVLASPPQHFSSYGGVFYPA